MRSKNRLIIFQSDSEQTKAALLNGDNLLEVYLETAKLTSLVGNIYRGKVRRVVPQMQSIFVDLGLAEPGLLSINDIVKKSELPLTEQFHQGQIVWVQVHKDRQVNKNGLENKGVRLTSDISLESTNLVLLPNSSGVMVSKKIQDRMLRTGLQNAAQQALNGYDYQGGLVIRSIVAKTINEQINDDGWLEDLPNLIKKWELISLKMKEKTKVGLVYQADTLLERLLNQCIDGQITQVEGVQQAASVFADSRTEYSVKDANELDGLVQELNLNDQLTQSTQKLVPLKGGGSIVVEQTEALIAIDVNMGSALDGNVSALEFNLKAAEAIAEQIRLRNLAGIIVIDFIRMKSKRERQQVSEKIQEEFLADFVQVKIVGFTRLGLFEISRQRVRSDLLSILDNKAFF